MTATDRLLLALLARSRDVRRSLQRWAMRYCARLLSKLGGPHKYTAELLWTLGASVSGHTLTGRPMPRQPAGTPPPQLVARIPALYQRHTDD